jgi:hypothetical protein
MSIPDSKPPTDFKGSQSIPAFDRNSPWMKKTAEFLVRMGERSGKDME